MSDEMDSTTTFGSLRGWKFCVLGAVLTLWAATFFFDQRLTKYCLDLQPSLREFHWLLRPVAQFGAAIIPIFVAICVYRRRESRASVVSEVGIAGILAVFVSQLLHMGYQCQRPFVVLGINPIVPHVPDLSFPSDHATLAFAIGTTLWFRWRTGSIITLAVASIASLMRILTLLHWASDIFTGALLGSAVACATHWSASKLKTSLGPAGWRAIFEKNTHFVNLVAVFRYAVLFVIAFRFWSCTTFSEHSLPLSVLGITIRSGLVVTALWILFALFTIITNYTTYYKELEYKPLDLSGSQSPKTLTTRMRNVLRLTLVGDVLFYSAFHILSRHIESSLFILLLLPLMTTSLFASFSGVLKGLALTVFALAVSLALIALELQPGEHINKQWLVLSIFAPRVFAMLLVAIPLAWLVHARSRYESLVESIPHYITRKNLLGKITFANQAFCELNSLTTSEIIGMDDDKLYGPQAALQYNKTDEQAIHTKGIVSIKEKHRPHKSDKEMDVEGWKIPIRDTSGEVVEVQVIFWDVTQRVNEQNQLARDTQLINSLFMTVPDNIYFKDLESRFTRINLHLAQAFGLRDPEEAIGKSDNEFFCETHAAEARAMEETIIKTGIPQVAVREIEVYKRNNQERIISTTKMPLREGPIGARFSPFLISDLIDFKGLVERLNASLDEVSKYLQTQFSEELRQALANLQRGCGTVVETQRLFLKELNTIIQGPSIFDGKRFSPDLLRPTTEELLKRELDSANVWRLNRHLVEDAYPSELARNQGAIVGTFGISRDIGDLLEAQEKVPNRC